MTQPSPLPETTVTKISSTGQALAWMGNASWRELFSIDLRALAALRIAVGLLILGDLFNRIALFEFFYGSFSNGEGFLTRSMNQIACPPNAGFWSVYWLADHPVFVSALMMVAALAAVGLIFGFKSRTMTIVSLVLFYSLNVRNPYVTTAGHVLLRMLLFWMMFLPVGVAWSVDARLARQRGKTTTTESAMPRLALSWATAAIMGQVAAMYFFSGIAKWNEDWLRGDALEIALHLEMYVKPFGLWLREFPGFLMTVTWATLLLEIIGPFFLFMPWLNRFWRVFLMTAFWAMHIGIWLTMSIGVFSLVAMAAWLVFLPSDFWDLKIWKWRSGPTTNEDQSARFMGAAVWVNVVCGLMLAYVLVLNLANVDPAKSKSWFPTMARVFGNATMVVQEFKMFGRPSHENIWFEMQASDAAGDGRENLLGPDSIHGSPRPKPNEIYQSMGSQHMRRLVFNFATMKATTEEQKSALRQWRARLSKHWYRQEIGGQAGQTNTGYVVICWRRNISLDFPQQVAYSEIWGRSKPNK